MLCCPRCGHLKEGAGRLSRASQFVEAGFCWCIVRCCWQREGPVPRGTSAMRQHGQSQLGQRLEACDVLLYCVMQCGPHGWYFGHVVLLRKPCDGMGGDDPSSNAYQIALRHGICCCIALQESASQWRCGFHPARVSLCGEDLQCVSNGPCAPEVPEGYLLCSARLWPRWQQCERAEGAPHPNGLSRNYCFVVQIIQKRLPLRVVDLLQCSPRRTQVLVERR